MTCEVLGKNGGAGGRTDRIWWRGGFGKEMSGLSRLGVLRHGSMKDDMDI